MKMLHAARGSKFCRASICAFGGWLPALARRSLLLCARQALLMMLPLEAYFFSVAAAAMQRADGVY